MKFSSILYAGTLAAAAIAAPLADLEREQFGSIAPRTHMNPEVAKRMPKGSSKPKPDKVKIQRIKSTRYKGSEETKYDYKERIRDAPDYPIGWKAVRDGTPEEGRTGTVLRRDSQGNVYKADHYYAEDTQPYTADLWDKTTQVYPQYASHGFKMRHGEDQRAYTLEAPHIATPKWARGTDREEEPPQSLYYPEGAFLVGRVPSVESKFQSNMLRAVDRPYPDAEHYFHDNRKDKSREVHVVRGPRGDQSRGAYDYDPRYGQPRVSSSRVDSYLYPAQPPSSQGSYSASSGANIVTIAPRYASSGSSSRRSQYPRDLDALQPVERDIFDNIEGQQSNANDTSRTAQIEQIEGFLWAFDQARDNATALLQPFLEDLLNGTNSYLGEAMAWGLYTMVHPDISLSGPFQRGMSTFGSANGADNTTNSTGNAASDQAWQQWGDSINAFYADLWHNATAVVNQTGLLADLDLLEGYLLPDDQTLLPDSQTTIDEHALDGFYDFLASMYAYNGYIFTANETANGTADFTLYPEDFSYGPGANVTAASNTTASKRSPSWTKLW